MALSHLRRSTSCCPRALRRARLAHSFLFLDSLAGLLASPTDPANSARVCRQRIEIHSRGVRRRRTSSLYPASLASWIARTRALSSPALYTSFLTPLLSYSLLSYRELIFLRRNLSGVKRRLLLRFRFFSFGMAFALAGTRFPTPRISRLSGLEGQQRGSSVRLDYVCRRPIMKARASGEIFACFVDRFVSWCACRVPFVRFSYSGSYDLVSLLSSSYAFFCLFRGCLFTSWIVI